MNTYCTSCGRSESECRRIVFDLDLITGCCHDCFAGRATHTGDKP